MLARLRGSGKDRVMRWRLPTDGKANLPRRAQPGQHNTSNAGKETVIIDEHQIGNKTHSCTLFLRYGSTPDETASMETGPVERELSACYESQLATTESL